MPRLDLETEYQTDYVIGGGDDDDDEEETDENELQVNEQDVLIHVCPESSKGQCRLITVSSSNPLTTVSVLGQSGLGIICR